MKIFHIAITIETSDKVSLDVKEGVQEIEQNEGTIREEGKGIERGG